FMDGVDGISAATAVVGGAGYAALGSYAGDRLLLLGGLAVAGAALGFAPLNTRGRLFLGDSGSYFFGGWFAALALVALADALPRELCVAPLLVYLADTGLTLARRVARGEQWHQPHRQHRYQALVIGGWTHLRTA